MLVGLSRYGKGTAEKALGYLSAGYLTSGWNRQGLVRNPTPSLVRGDPRATARIVNASPFAWKYSSGVLSFAPGDKLNECEQQQVMEEFEEVLFPGFSRDRFSVCWIRHEHTERLELHFLAARTDLETRKSYNPAPPGSRRLFDTFRDKINAQYGLASPSDPARARSVRVPAFRAKEQARAVREQGVSRPYLQPGKPDRPAAERAAKELRHFCEWRAAYNRGRYGIWEKKSELVAASPVSEVIPKHEERNDRTGETLAPSVGALDARISGARSACDGALGRVVGRTCGLKRGAWALREARERLDRTALAFGERVAEAQEYFHKRQMTDTLLVKYGVATKTSDDREREQEWELEPELCEDC